jgi:exopolyphosphatase/guanosine-5'-triphosphate,3'-diphosphate pyrophosphatase
VRRPPESVTKDLNRTRAVVSLGTNTVRLLVVSGADAGLSQVEHRQIGTRLGEGLGHEGDLQPEAMARTLAAACEFSEVARGHGADVFAIATSAMRRARNASAFAQRLHAESGLSLRILDGTLEAEASFRGATCNAVASGGRTAVLDIGGGSTECAVGSGGVLEAARSIETGSVRLTEAFPALGGARPGAPAREAARLARARLAEKLEPLGELRPVDTLLAVAGTALTIAALAFESHVDRVSGRTLWRETIDATVDELLDRDLEARRRLPGMLPQRADVLAAGGLIASESLRILGVASARLESNDLLLGYLLMQRGAVADTE